MESRQALRVVAAGTIGNVLEWYDFAIYGYFATAIGRQFFPHEDPVAQLLSAFGVFALGYLMRPVGGALIGHIGDRFGRRAALTFSVAAMAVPTFLIGLLPGYATLGLMAPIALTLLRMLQGLSVGGEYTSSLALPYNSARGKTVHGKQNPRKAQCFRLHPLVEREADRWSFPPATRGNGAGIRVPAWAGTAEGKYSY